MNTIYTLGYTGLNLARLSEYVERYDAQLVDVRRSARSANPRMSSYALAREFGDRYAHLGQLGNVNYKSGGPIRLANPKEGAMYVKQFLDERSVILLCACKDYRECHRVDAAEACAAFSGAPIEHLQPFGSEETEQARLF